MAGGADGGGVPADAVTFVCPLCRGPLDKTARPEAFACGPCRREYPLHDGIPDFRVFPDPYLGFEEDRDRTAKGPGGAPPLRPARAARVLLETQATSRPWPAGRFIRGALRARPRRGACALLDDGNLPGRIEARSVLEIGSGTGALLAVGGALPRVVGVDIAMRWLHVSRGVPDARPARPPLVCACGGAAASRTGPSTSWYGGHARGHPGPRRGLAEGSRVLARAGTVLLNTGNRFSLPQRAPRTAPGWASSADGGRSPMCGGAGGVDFSKIRPVSLRELNGWQRRFSARVRSCRGHPRRTVAGLSVSERLQVALYRRIKTRKLLRPLFLCFGPEWDVRLSKVPSPSAGVNI